MQLKTEIHTVTVLHVEVPAHISAREFEHAVWAMVPDSQCTNLRDGITVHGDPLNEALEDPAMNEEWPDAVREFLQAVSDWDVLPNGPDEFFFHR